MIKMIIMIIIMWTHTFHNSDHYDNLQKTYLVKSDLGIINHVINIPRPSNCQKNGENEYILILWGKKDTILNGANGGSSYI